ncbi:L,D-transpeptidase [Pseudorhodoplanes sp.]|uniref:L,D-transpeptidase n=1 Tax=Pseudorhodoplanes sp. TaxID=1934341 RepID=UPI003D14B7CA
MRSKRVVLGLQKTGQLAGVSMLALMVVGLASPQAEAQDRFFLRETPVQRFQGPPGRFEARRTEPRNRLTPRRATRAPVQQTAKPVKEAPPPPGPHMLIVSVKSQRASFYAGGKLVSQSPVSTGTATHPTPHGVFSIIQRNRHHRSNIYSGAPMPYMQRLTWSGIALHQGALPGYPASHGCIRLPEQYANFLWRTIKMNTRVIVSREDVEPFDVAHDLLFQPKSAPATVETIPELRKTFDTTTPARLLRADMPVIFTDASGARADGGSESGQPAEPAAAAEAPAKPDQPTMRDLSASVEAARSGVPAPTLAGDAAKPQLAAPAPSDEPVKPDVTASIYPQPAEIPEPILASFAQSLEAKQKKAPPKGAITVFISKKDKKLYVRQHFIPLFSAPVTFKDDKPNFGTHVFTALEQDGGDKPLRWVAVTLPPELPKAQKVKTRIEVDRRGRRIEVPVKPQGKSPEPLPSLSAKAALDRIEIAPDVVDRISEYVAAGASMIVSDHGLGYETGLYTDFIVVTQK